MSYLIISYYDLPLPFYAVSHTLLFLFPLFICTFHFTEYSCLNFKYF
jgi:hypothetical protein